jgi:hypothetical protein
MSAAYSASPSHAYLANVVHAAQELFKAIFAVRASSAMDRFRDKMEVLRLARECQDTAPSLSQELNAMASRD